MALLRLSELHKYLLNENANFLNLLVAAMGESSGLYRMMI